MIPVDEFFKKSRTEQQALVDQGHVVDDGEIAQSIPSPDDRGGVYVFKEPVTDQIVGRLKGAQYTANELEPEFPIGKEELDELLNWMKYEPGDLLANHFGVLRVANTEGTSYVYTIEVIPFMARCLDPTLSGYLLDANDRCPISRPSISTTPNRSDYEDYVEHSIQYWDLPRDDLTSQVDSNAELATSTLGPMPVVDDLPNANRVVDRFRSVGDSYRRKRYDVHGAKHAISFHKSRCRRNPSLAAFQSFSLYLFDLNEYATLENDSQLRELVIQGGEILYRCLFGDLWPGGPTSWSAFEVNVQRDLSTRDQRVIDIVEQQPTSNGQLADRWGFKDGKAVWNHLQNEFNQFVTRNSDQFACATESARRYLQGLESDEKVTLSKEPPRVPGKGRISLEVSESSSSDSGTTVDWSRG